MAAITIASAKVMPLVVRNNSQLTISQKKIEGSKICPAFGKKKEFSSFKLKASPRIINMAFATNVSRFEGVTMAPSNPILDVSEAFRADNSDLKMNLGVGAYRTEELQPYVLNVVKKAKNLMI